MVTNPALNPTSGRKRGASSSAPTYKDLDGRVRDAGHLATGLQVAVLD